MSGNILLVSYNISGYGGIETVCTQLHTLLKDHNINMNIIFIDEGLKDYNDDWLSNIPYQRISSNIRNKKIRMISYATKIKKYIKNKKIKHIICLDLMSCYIASLVKKLTLFSTIKTYSWLHFVIDNLYREDYLLKVDRHLAISSRIKEQLIERGIKEEKIALIFNPINENKHIIKRGSGNHKTFIYVGRIIAQGEKNLAELIQSLSLVQKEWTLHLIGDGNKNELEKLQRIINTHGVHKRVVFHGWQNDPWGFIETKIKKVDALFLTSIFEGFGMVLGEAISRGIFCISSNCFGPSDIINNDNGFLYTSGNIKELADKINKLYYFEYPDYITIKESISKLYSKNYIINLIRFLEK
ncbi:TPA: glycosyltransferase [Proteus mirabilis]|uniref:glycosyltransferase n=1 Tax=Proteus mirabilis TaxID=584 RepID=UPI0018C7B24E|nr:glycosyltransferase [Proteus mirabilis]EKV6230369.1 glycosyltransferase [Proteus mirabilis]MBG3006997.1 glycosyltransferase [Proteus mirabilis]MBG3082151.1 glycosyltransferase [Proteus mirabilis]MBG3085898.1 glycosyltransferase [Proteus mirabilis]MBG5945822.1 glycosyltransferase [Proteus mirabilis]